MSPKLSHLLNLTAFIFCSIILFCLILLTPADAIYQCYKTQRLINVFFIAGAYIVTFVLAVLIYATRIYTNRSARSGIPKAWIPVEREDLGKSVRRLVAEGLGRSAIITYQATPRDVAGDGDADGGGGEDGGAGKSDGFAKKFPDLTVDKNRVPWGEIEHPGWSSPEASDLPDLSYRTVVSELGNLIEAKAVSLAPADPFFTATMTYDDDLGGAEQQAIPDTRVVEVLQRPVAMGLREYIQHLTLMGVIRPAEVGMEFVVLYERARFSAHELFEDEFRELMHVFAELLRGMKGLDPRIVDEVRGASSDSRSGVSGDYSMSGGSSRSCGTESVIGPSDEEGETDTVDSHGSEVSSEYTTPARTHADVMQRRVAPRTPSMRSMRLLRREQSNVSGSSGRGVVRMQIV